MKYRVKLSKTGRILIPAAARHELHFEPGDELILKVENGELHLTSLKNAINAAQILIKTQAKSRLTKQLKALRKLDNLNSLI